MPRLITARVLERISSREKLAVVQTDNYRWISARPLTS
jgi:hypothetical protein